MRLFFIRHGQSTANLDRVYVGQIDAPLTEQGKAEAAGIRDLLSTLPFDRVYSSDLQRAHETQKIATPLLREFDVGSLAGQGYDAARSRLGRSRDFSPYGGENVEMVCLRLKQFLQELEADPCPYAAAFSHNGLINCMLRIALDADTDSFAARSDNCAIHAFEFRDGRWTLLAWNYMKPL